MTAHAYSRSMTVGVDLNLEPGHDRPTNEGDREQLAVAFSAHKDELRGFARRSLGDDSLADEAVQETFLRAVRAKPGFDPQRGAIRTWLFAIARRVIVDLARARSAHPSQELDPNKAAATDEIEKAMRSWDVEEALRRLGPDHRVVVIEIYYRGRASRDLAQQLGLPEGTVRSRLYYALRALRVALGDLGWSE